ncbi:protein Aster-C-like isoform X2 [Zophobas morio]|uniref:protein Aster-C-like isoform X2 n=1 Tax=Zophobas morio TaxID=2755281 RepID=UPI003082A836
MVGPTEAQMEELQTVLIKEDNKRYVVTTSTSALHIPYGNSFESLCKYCITEHGQNNCRLKITASIIWKKKVKLLKNYITSVTFEGIQDSVNLLETRLGAEYGWRPLNSVAEESGNIRTKKKTSPRTHKLFFAIQTLSKGIDYVVNANLEQLLLLLALLATLSLAISFYTATYLSFRSRSDVLGAGGQLPVIRDRAEVLKYVLIC